MATYGERLTAGVEKLKTMPINIDGNIINPNITYDDLFGQESLVYAISQDSVDPTLAYALRTELGEERYNQVIAEFQAEKERKYKQFVRPPIISERTGKTLTVEELFPEYTRNLERYNNRNLVTSGYERGNLPESALQPRKPFKPFGYDKAQRLLNFGLDPRKELDFDGIMAFRSATAALGFYDPTPADLNYQKQYLGTDVVKRLKDSNVRGRFADILPGNFQYAIPDDPSSGIVYVEEGKEPVFFDSPLFNKSDMADLILQETPLMAADIFLGTKGFKFLKDDILKEMADDVRFPKLKKVGDNFAFNLLLGGGVAATRFTQLAVGNGFGVHNRSVVDMAQEAGLIGLIAAGGNTVISGFMEGIPAVYRMLTGKSLPTQQLKALQAAFDSANASRTGGAKRLVTESGELEEISLRDIDRTIEKLAEEIGEDLSKFGKFDPSLPQASKDNISADLEQLILQKATDDRFAIVYDEMLKGNKKFAQKVFKAIFRDLDDNVTGETVARELVDLYGRKSEEFEDEGINIIARLSSELDSFKTQIKDKNILDPVMDDAASSRLISRFTTRINKIARDSQEQLATNVRQIFDDPRLSNIKLTGRGFRKELDEFEKLTKPGEEIQLLESEVRKTFNQLFPENLLKRLKSTREGDFTLSELNNFRSQLNSFASKNLDASKSIADQKTFDALRNLQNSIEDTIFNQLRKQLPKKDAEKYMDLFNAQKFGSELANQQVIKNLLQTQPEGVSGYLLATQNRGAGSNSTARDFMSFLKATDSYDEISAIRNDVVEYIQRNYFDTDMADPKTLAKNYQKFLKDKLPTLKEIFPEDQFGTLVANKQNFRKNVLDKIDALNKEQAVFETAFGSRNPFNIVSRILATGADDKASGAVIPRIELLEKLLKEADPEVRGILEKQISNATKKYILVRSSVDGNFDVRKLNILMNEGFAPEQLVGRDLSFKGVYGRLIQDEDKFFQQLDVLRDIGNRLDLNLTSPSQIRKQIDQQVFDPGTEYLRRFLIPPLTPFGRKATALENVVKLRNANFMAELFLDQNLLNTYIRAIQSGKEAANFAKILQTYDTIHSRDISSTLDFYNREDKRQEDFKTQTLSQQALERALQKGRRIGAFN
tara:strand:+ start:1783 stop:5127 length:3345 start_codon:yes stop_codon:yes gene_type:complete